MAAERGWQALAPNYRENDTSASTRSRKRRPVFEQLLTDVVHGAITVLLAYPTYGVDLQHRSGGKLDQALVLQRPAGQSGRARLQRAEQGL